MQAASVRLSASVVLFVSLFLAGCDTQDLQANFAQDASKPAAGFTRTDQDGRVLDNDPDDWRTAPFFIGRVRVEPAFPNPVNGGITSLTVSLLEFNAVRGGVVVRGFSSTGNQLRELARVNATDPGTYVLTLSPSQLGRNGLIRVYLFDFFGELISYGDLMVP